MYCSNLKGYKPTTIILHQGANYDFFSFFYFKKHLSDDRHGAIESLINPPAIPWHLVDSYLNSRVAEIRIGLSPPVSAASLHYRIKTYTPPAFLSLRPLSSPRPKRENNQNQEPNPNNPTNSNFSIPKLLSTFKPQLRCGKPIKESKVETQNRWLTQCFKLRKSCP